MALTIIDIAREAGVSKSTVSLVLNHSQTVKTETRHRVEQVISRLGYVPNQAARQLITKASRTLGLVFLTSNHFTRASEFSSVPETLLYDVSAGINAELTNTDYTLLTERFSVAEGSTVLPGIISKRRLDGIVFIGGLVSDDFIERVKKLKIPLILIGRQYKGIDSVFVDVEQAGYLGARHLLEKGHRNILFVNGPELNRNSILKKRGVESAAREMRASPSSIKVIHSGYAGIDAYGTIKNYWKNGPRPGAIFCGSDGIAGGVMRFLYEKGLQVPADVSVISTEYSLLSEYIPPRLTSIDWQKENIGKEACRILLNRINKPSVRTINLKIPPVLIEQDSVRASGAT
ncbi:MAG: LacI family transcriptional regulator [Treponema sp.]|nr:LacI family transcriptional regulator [Treponema sp.]